MEFNSQGMSRARYNNNELAIKMFKKINFLDKKKLLFIVERWDLI